MITLEDLGLTTNLPDFCKGCTTRFLEMNAGTLYVNDGLERNQYIQSNEITCENLQVCKNLYGRIKTKNKAVIARTLADYMTLYGISHTMSGNYHFDFEEINEIFATNLPEDKELMDLILDTVDRNIVSDLDVTEDFDFMFYLGFCPYAQED